MGTFKIDNEFWVFEIRTDFPFSEAYYCVTYGSPDTCIEVRVDFFTNNISDIQCIYLGNFISEPYIHLPDIRSDPDLIALDTARCNETEDRRRLPCVVNLTREELQLIIKANSFDAHYYYADGRIEYYYDENMNLLHIKVLHLTEEEYTFLKSGGAAGEYFHWT